MNESLQQLETKVENQGATPQGKVSAVEWNVLVAAVKQLDSSGINNDSLKKYLQQYQYITRPELSGILDDAAPDLSGVVNTSGEQDVVGIKNFVNGLKLSNKPIRYDADKNVFIFPGNILAEGGVAWNTKLEGFEEQTITAAVQVDWKTIGKNDNGELCVIGGVVGGVTIDEVKNYLTNEGYATQVWVNEQGFLKSITSSMVTTALGYTPYNTSNFTKANIKSTLGISDWALASAKPTYTASEVGALGVNDTAQSALKMTSEYLTDLNSATPWRFFDMNTGYGSTDGNKPNTTWVSGITGTVAGSSNYRWQLAGTTGSQNPYFRQERNGNWNDWKTLAFTSDIPTKLSQLTDDVVKGNYLSTSGGTVNGNITATGNVSAQNVVANSGITVGSVLSFVDTDASKKIVLQRNSSGDILFCGGFADRNVYIDGSILRVRTENTIFSSGISTTGVTLRSGDKSAVISYNASKNAFVFPANAIFEGGVAWNSSLDGFEPQTVTDAVNVDGVTIGRTTSGALTVLAGAGGGINEAQLANYLTTNNYAKKSDIPSLSGYATEAFVTSRGYITSAAIPTKVSTFDNDSGYITGITSSMVTSALGYTPYNAANFTKANIKSTLGISDWALASAKPTYTASEVGALGVNDTAQSALKMTSEYLTDLNSATPWRFFDMNTGYGSTDGNKPNTAWVSGITGTVAGSSNFRWQLAGTTGSQNPYFRQERNGNWNDWKTLAFTSDIPTKLSQFTDDVVKGNYLSTSGGTVNGVLSIQSVLRLSDIDNTYKVVLQRDSSGNILFGAGFADSNMYIDADVLRIRSNSTIFSREISTIGLVLRSGSQSATISYNASKNAFVFPANAIFEGGVAWNSPMDGTSAYASELERRIEALQTEVDTLKQTVQTLTA